MYYEAILYYYLFVISKRVANGEIDDRLFVQINTSRSRLIRVQGNNIYIYVCVCKQRVNYIMSI